MARFRCRACGREGTFEYDGRHACPDCASPDVQFALGIEELADDDAFLEAIRKLTEGDDDADQVDAGRFRCADCGHEGEHSWDPNAQAHRCPACGSPDIVFGLTIDQLPAEVVEALLDAEPLDDENEE
jgi:Zn finger protein HypA/HybF involved in hydrogenase expression